MCGFDGSVLRTTRLELRPNHPEHLLALIEGNEQYAEVSGLTPGDGLREFFTSGDVSPDFLAQLRKGKKSDPWKFGFAVLLLNSDIVVGSAGFKGPPDSDGIVEIAYGIVPKFQGRGFATEVAASLVSCASRHDKVLRLRAHTSPETNASSRVLAKCGFEFVGQIADPEHGPVWRWERPKKTP